MKNYKKELGRSGENLAADFLRLKGHMILERNYRTKSGEIDIITKIANVIHFVEVKTYSQGSIRPEDGITNTKIRHLRNAALMYLSRNTEKGLDYCFDLMALIKTRDNFELKYFENIF